MSHQLRIYKNTSLQGYVRSLPSSKSLSNRALILQALTKNKGTIENLSPARDTTLMRQGLTTTNQVINVMDAGTTMRFLTAYYGITGQSRVITGTDRMKERPIRLLVDALRMLGVTIDYLSQEGFPPIEIKGFSRQLTDTIPVRGDVSSQFISALMMIAPLLPQGLTIRLEGKVGSLPYLTMTAELMAVHGIRPEVSAKQIRIPPGSYRTTTYRVEPDWSAASYWFAFAALADTSNFILPGVQAGSLQGDRVIAEIMQPLGVKAEFQNDGLRLTKTKLQTTTLTQDFSHCPDLAQTVFPVCAALGIRGEFSGLESLRIKETDRISALQTELAKINTKLIETGKTWTLIPGRLSDAPSFSTYHDHRMAMGFAPLATRTEISIDSSEVVNKSYPSFWDDMKGLGFRIVQEN